MTRYLSPLLCSLIGLPLLAEDAAPPADPATDGQTADPVIDEPAPTNSTWSLLLRNSLRLGFDSNVPLQPEDSATSSDEDSFAWQDRLEVGAIGRITDRDRVQANLTAQYNGYTSVDDLDLARIGAVGTWQRTGGEWIPHAVLGLNNYWIDGDSTLFDASLYGGAARMVANKGVAIGAIQLRQLDYQDSDSLSGTRLLLRGGYWFLFGSAGRRIEVDLRLGHMAADEDFETYTTVRPAARVRWRWDDGIAGNRTDAHAGLSLDFRQYADPRPGADDEESATLIAFEIGADWAFHEQWSLGTEMQFTQRASDVDGRDYDRTRFFTELTFVW